MADQPPSQPAQPPPEQSLPLYAPAPPPPQYPNASYPGQPPIYGYAAPPYAYHPVAPAMQTSGFAIASLVVSLVSWFVIPLIGGIAAVIFGHIARNEIRKSNGTMSGDGMALAGLILGYIQIAIMVIGIVFIIWFIAILASHPNTTY